MLLIEVKAIREQYSEMQLVVKKITWHFRMRFRYSIDFRCGIAGFGDFFSHGIAVLGIPPSQRPVPWMSLSLVRARSLATYFPKGLIIEILKFNSHFQGSVCENQHHNIWSVRILFSLHSWINGKKVYETEPYPPNSLPYIPFAKCCLAVLLLSVSSQMAFSASPLQREKRKKKWCLLFSHVNKNLKSLV